MFKKILIATDGSSHGEKATAVGADIASKYGAEVVLVHVILRNELSGNLRHMAAVEGLTAQRDIPLLKATPDMPAARFPADIAFTEQQSEMPFHVLEAISAHIMGRAENIAREHGVPKVKKCIEDGDPVKRILEVIKAEKVDLVVSGARGLSDFKALLIGSVSHKLSHLSPVTCVTVH